MGSNSICTAYFTCASLDLGNLFTCRLFTEKCTCGLTVYLNRSWIYYLILSDLQTGGKSHKMIMMLFFYSCPNGQVICILFVFDGTFFSFHWVKIVQLIMALVNILSYCPLKIIVYNSEMKKETPKTWGWLNTRLMFHKKFKVL